MVAATNIQERQLRDVATALDGINCDYESLDPATGDSGVIIKLSRTQNLAFLHTPIFTLLGWGYVVTGVKGNKRLETDVELVDGEPQPHHEKGLYVFVDELTLGHTIVDTNE